MGISTYMSYTGAQQFEAVGLAKSLVDKYFTGTASNVEGIDLFDVAEEAIRVHRAAFDEPRPGARSHARCRRRIRLARARRGPHLDARRDRQAAAFARARTPYSTYKEYAALINDQSKRHLTFRGLFEFKSRRPRAGAARGSRAGGRDRQALLDRRHVARLDLDRGAHRAGDRHEPHRRQARTPARAARTAGATRRSRRARA